MDVTRILAIRHGETPWNVDTRIQGHIDIGLNAQGQWQAQQVARALAEEPIAHVYSSDLQRAHDTARAIAQVHGLTPSTTPGLRERGFGHFEGKTWAEIEHLWPEDAQRWRTREPAWQPTGGESLLDLQARITDVAHELAARHPGELIVWVAHGGVMDMLYRLATGQSLQAPRTWSLRNTAINRLLWTRGQLQLVGWGDERHLSDPAQDESTT